MSVSIFERRNGTCAIVTLTVAAVVEDIIGDVRVQVVAL